MTLSHRPLTRSCRTCGKTDSNGLYEMHALDGCIGVPAAHRRRYLVQLWDVLEGEIEDDKRDFLPPPVWGERTE